MTYDEIVQAGVWSVRIKHIRWCPDCLADAADNDPDAISNATEVDAGLHQVRIVQSVLSDRDGCDFTEDHHDDRDDGGQGE